MTVSDCTGDRRPGVGEASVTTRGKGRPAVPGGPGSGRGCVEQLVDHAGSVALATRFTIGEGAGALEGLILVMPEPQRIAKLLSHPHLVE